MLGGVWRAPGDEVSGLRNAPDESGWGDGLAVGDLVGRCGEGNEGWGVGHALQFSRW